MSLTNFSNPISDFITYDVDADELTYGLVMCECCHDLFDVFQMRVDEFGHCYCDKCCEHWDSAYQPILASQ